MRRLVSNPWIVCMSAASFFLFQYFQMTSFNVLIPDLVVSLNTDATTLSIISALYFYGTVLFLIPAGIVLDNMSPRKIILLAMSVSIIGLVLFSITDSVYISGAGRFLIGVSGGPFCFLSNMRLAARWFPPQRLAFVSGMIVAVAMLGGVLAQTPFTMLIDAIGWRAAMWVNISFGIFLIGIIYLFVYDYPVGKEQEYKEQLAYYRREGFVKGLKTVVLKAQNWYAGLYASLLNLPIFVFGALWGMTYLTHVHNISRSEASIICSLLFFGMLIGAPLFGYISDTLRLRKAPMLIGAIICLIATMIALKCSSFNCFGMSLIFFWIGLGSSAQVLAYPMVSESNKPALAGSALGLAATLIMLGGAIVQPVIGTMLDMPTKGASNFSFAMSLMPIAILISMIMVLMLRETYCKNRN